MENTKAHEYYMKEALKEAKKAYKKEEVPVGAVIVKDGEIISRGYNLKEIKNDRNKTCRNDSDTKSKQKASAHGDLKTVKCM